MLPAIESLGPIAGADLWLVDLDAPEALSWRSTLSDAERERAARFVFPRDRSRYEAAHGALRHLLARSAGRSPDAVQLTSGAFGKPSMATHEGIEFNLSHSQDAALIAIGRAPLGVDIEVLRPLDDWRSLAAAHFTRAEQAVIASRPAEAQSIEFLRCWTRKEACLKALGLGLSLDTRAVDVRLDQPDSSSARVETREHGALAVRSLTIGMRAIASIAFVAPSATPTPSDRLAEVCA